MTGDNGKFNYIWKYENFGSTAEGIISGSNSFKIIGDTGKPAKIENGNYCWLGKLKKIGVATCESGGLQGQKIDVYQEQTNANIRSSTETDKTKMKDSCEESMKTNTNNTSNLNPKGSFVCPHGTYRNTLGDCERYTTEPNPNPKGSFFCPAGTFRNLYLDCVKY